MFKLMSFRSDAAFWPMAEPHEAKGGASSPLASLLRAPARLAAAIGQDLAARRAAHALASLDDRMLRDIGIVRDQIHQAARYGRAGVHAADARTELAQLW
jgi:uncharacterized protein YjiS (DUF1127 family)